MEQRGDKVYAYFWITDFDYNFSEITRLMGIKPTKAGNKGEVVWKRVREHGFWDLYSPLPQNNLFIDRHIVALLEIIEPKKEILAHLRNQGCTMGINCVGYFMSNPGFHLPADLISRCASLGLSLDFDLYCLDSEESQ